MPSDTKTIYIIWTNTDLTEGRGQQVPIAYTESPATAARLAMKRGVMGSNAEVRPFEAVKINGYWCAPVAIQSPSKDDIRIDQSNDRRAKVLAKAKAAGLTDEDLAALRAAL